MKVVNINTQEYSNTFPKTITYNGRKVLNPTIEILMAVGWRYCKEITLDDGYRAANLNWSQDPENPRQAIATYDLINISEEETQKELNWQNNKSLELKIIENTYIDFLTNEWTPTLRNNGLIPSEHTITTNNTDEKLNVGLLLQLRTINKDAYVYCSNEFLKFKSMIKELKGIMSKVQQHEI